MTLTIDLEGCGVILTPLVNRENADASASDVRHIFDSHLVCDACFIHTFSSNIQFALFYSLGYFTKMLWSHFVPGCS